jgi:hypothetical protein
MLLAKNNAQMYRKKKHFTIEVSFIFKVNLIKKNLMKSA